MKKRTSNVPSTTHRINSHFGEAQDKLTSNDELDPRLRGDDKGTCEDCVFSVGVKGVSAVILACRNKADFVGRSCIVGPDEFCENFTRDKEILAPELVEALAEGAKLIPLTQDKFAIVDAEDYEWLNQYKWYASRNENGDYYAKRMERGTRRQIIMHRVITEAPPGLLVDHRNHNGLDNRRSNLRICTKAENVRNQLPRGGTSRYKGVSWSKSNKKYAATIRCNKQRFHLGWFDDEIAAAKAYDEKARELFGEFAYLNFPAEGREETSNTERSTLNIECGAASRAIYFFQS